MRPSKWERGLKRRLAPRVSDPDASARGRVRDRTGALVSTARSSPLPGRSLRRTIALGATLLAMAGTPGAVAAEFANPTGVALIIGSGD